MNEKELKRTEDRQAKLRKEEDNILKKKSKEEEKFEKGRKQKEDEKKKNGSIQKFLKPVPAESSKPKSTAVSSRTAADSTEFERAIKSGMTIDQINERYRSHTSVHKRGKLRKKKMLEVHVQVPVHEPGFDQVDGLVVDCPMTESGEVRWTADPQLDGASVAHSGDGVFAAATAEYYTELKQVFVDR